MSVSNRVLTLNVTFIFGRILQIKPEEIAAIMKDFDEPGTLAPTGLYLGGTKYMVIQGEAGAVIRGKKVRNHIVLDLIIILI